MNSNVFNPAMYWHLMPGDIISANGLPARVFMCSLDGLFSAQLIEPDDAEASESPYDYSRILPLSELESVGIVEITKEILLYNGFVNDAHNSVVEDGESCCFSLFTRGGEKIVDIILSPDGNNPALVWSVAKKPKSLYTHNVQVKYMHELQHLLRGLGHWSFADNFKV